MPRYGLPPLDPSVLGAAEAYSLEHPEMEDVFAPPRGPRMRSRVRAGLAAFSGNDRLLEDALAEMELPEVERQEEIGRRAGLYTQEAARKKQEEAEKKQRTATSISAGRLYQQNRAHIARTAPPGGMTAAEMDQAALEMMPEGADEFLQIPVGPAQERRYDPAAMAGEKALAKGRAGNTVLAEGTPAAADRAGKVSEAQTTGRIEGNYAGRDKKAATVAAVEGAKLASKEALIDYRAKLAQEKPPTPQAATSAVLRLIPKNEDQALEFLTQLARDPEFRATAAPALQAAMRAKWAALDAAVRQRAVAAGAREANAGGQ